MHEIIDKDLKFVNDVIIPTELKVYKAMKIDNIMEILMVTIFYILKKEIM